METKLIDKECASKMLTLAKSDVPYSEIGKRMTALGYKTPSGLAICTKTVSATLISQGYRKQVGGKDRQPKNFSKPLDITPGRHGGKRRRKYKTRSLNEPTIGSKWLLLSTIEDCIDLNPATKRALIQLVFQELNK